MATTEDRGAVGGLRSWRKRFDAAPLCEDELTTTISGLENELLHTPETVDIDYERDLGYPGAYPLTRGYPSMYRGRVSVDSVMRHADRHRR